MELTGLVHRIGERSDKHQHLLDQSLELSQGELTLLAVLLLRGAQTLGELHAHSGRMTPLKTHAEVKEALDALCQRDDPLVARLERQAGHKEARYGQLLVDIRNAHATSTSDAAAPLGLSLDSASLDSEGQDSLSLTGLAREVALLRTEVAELRKQLEWRDVNGGLTP